jgi:hypothetical protein
MQYILVSPNLAQVRSPFQEMALEGDGCERIARQRAFNAPARRTKRTCQALSAVSLLGGIADIERTYLNAEAT